ncbi:PREDICTED: OTU domain-containing protein 6A [Chrysochloris asiatica]|uniref:ubiquitinyl hydrolase 1 n=1 Tax=Chrysochloris asiatica TaxID=185453 RepID=A0A9B0TX68_CHRAS|nr:PREDICTED: OTU domain-containing protein 6A [Chrysochloris asiatica]
MDDSQREYQRMIRRHNCENKELQALIHSMKNSVPKSEKSRRKQLLLDVARLEAKLEQKHSQELEKFRDSNPEMSILETVTEDLAKMDLENKPPHLTRTQRRRERRAALEREHRERITGVELEHLAAFRRNEEEKLAVILGVKNLEMKDIRPDGHCMYRAIQDQLVYSVTVESLRNRTADYMQKHVDDFMPFFSDPETGDVYGRDDFLSYCNDIMCNASWGGQLELRALSHVLQTPIEVIQADSPVVVIGEEYTAKPLVLVYMRYTCNLGEHYNSVKPLEARAAPRLF